MCSLGSLVPECQVLQSQAARWGLRADSGELCEHRDQGSVISVALPQLGTYLPRTKYHSSQTGILYLVGRSLAVYTGQLPSYLPG